MSFEDYLKENHLRQTTIQAHLKDMERFNKWCTENRISYQKASYNQLLKFIEHGLEKGLKKHTLNCYLLSIRKYYGYLVKTAVRKENPARDLRLKNRGKKVTQGVMTPEQLEELYRKYKEKPSWEFRLKTSTALQARNIVLLGLLICQGLDTRDIKKLETGHINLSQGSIYIPSRSRSNSRLLKLHAVQILPLEAFMKGRKGLLIEGNMTGIADWLLKTLTRLSPEVKTIRQIRSSVIIGWLKHYNIRQVQYMAGHRYISSTEKYRQEDLEDLQTQLNLFHPLQ